MTRAQAERHVDRLTAARDEELPFREETLAWLGRLAAAKSIRLLGHDAVTPAEIDEPRRSSQLGNIRNSKRPAVWALHRRTIALEALYGGRTGSVREALTFVVYL